MKLKLVGFHSSSKRHVIVDALLMVWLSSLILQSNAQTQQSIDGTYDCKIGCPFTVDPICDTTNQVSYQNSCLARCQHNLVDTDNLSKGKCNDEIMDFDIRESKSSVMVDLDTIQKYQHESCTFVGFFKVSSLDPTASSSTSSKLRHESSSKKVTAVGHETKRSLEPHQSFRITPGGEMYCCTFEHSPLNVGPEPSAATATTSSQKHMLLRRNIQEIPVSSNGETSPSNDDLTQSNVDLTSIIGTDTRSEVTSLNSAPYKMIGLISNPGCTGSIIAQQWIITAGHCYYDPSLQKYFNNPYATFSPAAYIDGQGTRQYPNGRWQVEYVAIDQRFIQGDSTYDFSLMKIKPNSSNQNIGDVMGKFSLRTIGSSPTCGTFTNSNWRVTGYPSDKGMGEMYDSGSCESWTIDCSNPRVTHTCDTYSGQSGSPIYDKTTSTIYGVHTAGGSSSNRGTFLSDAHLSYIQSVIGLTTATSTATERSSNPTTSSSISPSTVQLTESYTHIGGAVMFEMKAKVNMQVIQLAAYIQSTTGTTITVYTKDGTLNGYESSTTGWTKVLSKSNVVGKGGQTPVYLPSFSSPLSITAGNTRSFLIMASDNLLFYQKVYGSKGDVLKSNANLVIFKGAALVSGTVFSPRVWTGRVKYQVTANEAAGNNDTAPENGGVSSSIPLIDHNAATVNESVTTPLIGNITTGSLSVVIDGSVSSSTVMTSSKLFRENNAQIMVRLSIQTDKYGGETSWKIYKQDKEKEVVMESSIFMQHYGNSQLYTHEFSLDPNLCYILQVSDSYGDGQCCQYGNGFYSLSDSNGGVLISGSVYRYNQASSFGKC